MSNTPGHLTSEVQEMSPRLLAGPAPGVETDGDGERHPLQGNALVETK